MKKHLILSLLLLLPLVASADAVEIDGIYYNLVPKAKSAEVTSNPNKYTGEVVIPDAVTYNDVSYSVTSIGNNAFYYCSGLTSITIPGSVTSIGSEAFYYCRSLTSVIIPDGVTSIGNAAFSGCTSLNTITLPANKLTFNGTYAFGDQNNIKSVYIKDLKKWLETSFEYGNNPLRSGAKLYLNGDELTNLVVPDGTEIIMTAAFEGCQSLQTVTIPATVTNIDGYAFAGCSGLTSITIGSSVTSIGNSAFYGCSGLTSVTIPSSVTSIGGSVFYGCSSLTSVTIPEGVTTINNNAFQNCSSLTYIILPSTLTRIYGSAFAGCTELLDVLCYAESVPSTASDAFKDSYVEGVTLHVPATAVNSYKNTAPWSGFKEVVEMGSTTAPIFFADANVKTICVEKWDTSGDGELSEGEAAAVTNLGDAFTGKTFSTFNELRFFTGLTAIGDYAFQGCSGMTAVTIPDNVTSIGYGAFEGCSGLTSLALPDGVTSIAEGAFKDCSGLTAITIPSNMTEIEYGIFEGCSSLASVNFPNGLTAIGPRAFQNCAALELVAIPASVTSIGNGAFNGCSNLTTVKVKFTSPLTIAPNTFSNRANATLEVPAGCEEAFSKATYWKDFKSFAESSADIVFADAKVKAICVENWDTDNDGDLNVEEAAAVTSLGGVFRNNQSITSFDELIYFTGLSSIDGYAFNGCSGLTSIAIPKSVTSIGSWAFQNCSSLTSVTISDLAAWCRINFGDWGNPLTAAHHLFLNDEEVTDLVIPEGVTSIGDAAFSDCYGLTSVTIPSSVTSINIYAFRFCKGLTSVTIGNSVTSIGDNAFEGCSDLASITIPNSVTSIGRYAFNGCNGLKSVTLGNSVSSIGDNAFYNCWKLTDVYCYAENVPTTTTNAFNGVNTSNATLHVPASAYDDYKTTAPWSSFGTIVALEGQTIPKCATPTITFTQGKLKFSCETEDVTFVSTITVGDAATHYDEEVPLSAVYKVRVIAKKSGHQDSDPATMDIDLMSLMGDANRDGEISIADAVRIVNIILGNADNGSGE